MKSSPTYFLKSVDNALHLAQILRDEGPLRLSDAAQRLNISVSTAHRLLSMLRYRGFAVQDETRAYLPGPSLSAEGISFSNEERLLMSLAEPHLRDLRNSLQETVNLMVRVGSSVRFLLTLEPKRILRVSDRQGTVLPARLVSGGKAILSVLEPSTVRRLLENGDDPWGLATSKPEIDRLISELEHVRESGYALNISETDEGVGAIGMVLTDRAGRAVGAVSVAAPRSRFPALITSQSISRIREARIAIEKEISSLDDRIDSEHSDIGSQEEAS